MPKLAALLLLLASGHEFVWRLYPAVMQAEVWQITGALSRACLMFIIGLFAMQSKLVWFVVLFAISLDLQVAWCAFLFIIDPWTVNPGQDVCTARYEIPFAVMSGWAALILVLKIRKRIDDHATN